VLFAVVEENENSTDTDREGGCANRNPKSKQSPLPKKRPPAISMFLDLRQLKSEHLAKIDNYLLYNGGIYQILKELNRAKVRARAAATNGNIEELEELSPRNDGPSSNNSTLSPSKTTSNSKLTGCCFGPGFSGFQQIAGL